MKRETCVFWMHSPGWMAITKAKAPFESVLQTADPERTLKSWMLGNPLVRFCEGHGGNQMMVRVTPSLRAPCLLDPGFQPGEANDDPEPFYGFSDSGEFPLDH